jgi:heat shock protein HslJ
MRKLVAGIVAVLAVAFAGLYILWTFPGPGSLTGTTWQWTEFTTKDQSNHVTSAGVIPDPEHYTMVFNADGTIVLTADCNQAPWSYTTSGRSMDLRSHAKVWSRCGADSRAQEMVDSLAGSTTTYSVWFGQLVLDSTSRGPNCLLYPCKRSVLTFRAQ